MGKPVSDHFGTLARYPKSNKGMLAISAQALVAMHDAGDNDEDRHS